MLLIYLFKQNKDISLYSIIHLLEQYNIWSKDKNETLFYSIKEKINEYIDQNYSKEIIEQFLFMNKYKDLSQLFDKFEVSKKIYDYKEIKIDNINIINDGNNFECKCELCTDDKACIQKIMDLNKNKINIVNDTSIYFEKASPEEYHNICQNNLIKKVNRNNIFHNNEEMFFKNINEKIDNNYYFTKSKTIFIERPNIEFSYIPIKNQYKIINPKNINDENIKNNLEIINNDIAEITENDKENNKCQNEDIIDYEEERKNFKNISKNIKENPQNSSKKEKEKNEIDNSEIDEKIIIKEDEDIEENKFLDEDSQSKKNEKKNKKAKSRIKNKKKKDFTKMNNEKDDKIEENKNENEEKVEEGKKEDEKSNKKKKKSGNSTVKKKHKSKFGDKNKEEDKNELEEMLKEEIIANENEKEIDGERDNNSSSKKMKSKSPNRKKNKKH